MFQHSQFIRRITNFRIQVEFATDNFWKKNDFQLEKIDSQLEKHQQQNQAILTSVEFRGCRSTDRYQVDRVKC